MYLINKEVKLVRSALSIPDTISYMQASDLDKQLNGSSILRMK